METMKKTAIINVHVFDGHRGLDDLSTVTISGPLIVDVSPYNPENTLSPDIDIIDGAGCTLLPGLIDSHVHVDKPEQLDDLASAGVTTALDMASFPHSLTMAIRDASLATAPDGSPRPAFLTAGLFATAPGSMHSKLVGGLPAACLSSPEEARNFVAKRVEEGSDYIKVVTDIPGPSQDVLDALVAAARTSGKKTVAHAATYEPFRMAVESGADLVTHVPIDRPVDAAWAEALAEEDRTCCPTLIMMKGICQARNAGPPAGEGHLPRPDEQASESKPKRELSICHSNDSVRALVKAGVRILAGTDAHITPFAPVKHGRSMHQELHLMYAASMGPLEILRSATSVPAKYWGLQGKGVVEPNATADLLLVEGQPLEDITDIGNVKSVWISGKKVAKTTGSQ